MSLQGVLINVIVASQCGYTYAHHHSCLLYRHRFKGQIRTQILGYMEYQYKENQGILPERKMKQVTQETFVAHFGQKLRNVREYGKTPDTPVDVNL